MSSNEIVFYKTDSIAAQIEVRVENDSVWLNRIQLASLFDRDVKTIGKHVNNALKEELQGHSVVAKFATTAMDGKRENMKSQNATSNCEEVVDIAPFLSLEPSMSFDRNRYKARTLV